MKTNINERNQLRGKKALITGGAKRLGRETALALAREGADVAITFLKSAHDAKKTMVDVGALGVQAIALECDVRDPKSVKTAVSDVLHEFGGLDLLVNNAGFFETAEFEKLTPEQWDNIFAVNTRGPFLVAQEAARHLRRRNGRIVNLGSLGGQRPWSTHAHYCSSKAALHMLTEVMAKALAPAIAVNCVAPGMIDLGEKSAAAFFRRTALNTPMKRNGTAADVTAAVLFFAGAPHFITGQILTVDGGLGLK
jgi:3-oxoacyl-[acyl-carrier protein] reductase/pteridine reductase